MRDLFPGWVPPDEATLDQYWNEATFAVDTSVLLDLYRFSEEARQGLLKALRAFGSRLWIPHQVGLEFHRNRLGVLLDQREAENNLLRQLDQIRENLDEQLSQLLKGAGRRDLAPLREAIDEGFDSLRENLKEVEKEHTKGLGESIRDDPIYEEVVELCAERVGMAFDDKRQAAVIEDAERRFESQTPPGYLDRGKDEKTKYGDVILWHQLCERALETGKPVVLIADDRKSDWVWEVRGKTIGPRPELVAEMSERAGVGFHLYTPIRFLEMWEQREGGQNVEPDVLAEIEGSGKKDPPEPSVSTIGELLDVGGLETQYHWPAFQRPALVLSSVASSHVDLAMEFRPSGVNDVPGSFRVTVRSPAGDRVSAKALPTSVSPDNLGLVFNLRYPSDFLDAGDLYPGNYSVTWEALFTNSDGLLERILMLGHDSFRITRKKKAAD